MRYQQVLAFCVLWRLIAPMPNAEATSLQEAMKMAANAHPQAHIADLRRQAAAANVREQAAYTYNPELSIEPQRRNLAGGGRSNDYYITLSQGIETAGKRGYRKTAAEAGSEAASAAQKAMKQRLMIDAATAYINLFYAQKALVLNQQISKLYAQLAKGVLRRFRAGEASKLDVNLIQSSYASSLNALLTSEQDVLLKKQAYFNAIGKTNAALPERLPDVDRWQEPTDIFEHIWQTRPDIQVLRQQEKKAAALARLADANRIPDITLSAMAAREAGDRLLKIGITIPLPVFNTHRGSWRAALANAESSRTRLAWAKQQLRFELDAAQQTYEASFRAARAVTQSAIMKHSDEAIALARKAWEAGELEPEEMVLRIRQATDAKLTSMETLRQHWLARIQLARVLGQPTMIIKGREQ